MSDTTIVLAPVTSSVPEARRFVANRLSDLPPETVDVARLLVSELVTNAVLHGQTELSLTVDRTDSKVAVQVADSNPLLPVLRTHNSEAGTGRGLRVLDHMASNWGSYRTDEGKIVWFELGTGGTAATDATGAERAPAASTGGEAGEKARAEVPDASRAPEALRDPRRARIGDEPEAGEELIAFVWAKLPLAKLDETAAHYDSVLREFHLVLEREPSAKAAVPGRLISLMNELTRFGPLMTSVEQDLERGRESGADRVDVRLDLPVGIGQMAVRLDNLLDEADAYCAAGVELLSLEPAPGIVNVRKWLIGELARQAEGHAPVPWPESPWATPSVSARRPKP